MKKLLIIVFSLSLLIFSFSPSYSMPIPLNYMGDFVINKDDLKQSPGAENLLEIYWGFDVTETENIWWSDTTDTSGDELVAGTWWSTHDLLGISWKAGKYWQVFALDPNQSSGTWDLTDLWDAAGKEPELSNIKGFIGGISIPESATMLLLGVGLIGLAGFGRKSLFKKS